MKTHEKPKVEKIICHICEKPFKTKGIFEKHLEKHTETTAEEYKEKKLKEAEEKKKRSKGTAKRRRKSSVSTDEGDIIDENEDMEQGNTDDAAAKILIGKRKQRTPSKILYDEDLNTKCVIRKKFDRKNHTCRECSDSFRSYHLLRSHMKLHAQQKQQQKQQISDNDSAESQKTNNDEVLYVAVQQNSDDKNTKNGVNESNVTENYVTKNGVTENDIAENDFPENSVIENNVPSNDVASAKNLESQCDDMYDERRSKDLLQLADISVSLAAAATSDLPTSSAS